MLGSGEDFDGYTIERLLGAGGMGEVYLAQHPRLPRHDALKVLHPNVSNDREFRQRFTREADLAATLTHPNIVTVHDRGDHNGQLWIATQYIAGTDAAQLLRDRYPAGMPLEDATAIITAIAAALDYAHDEALVHRDVKPANILLSDPDRAGRRQVYLADFGIARPLSDTSGLTATNTTLGTFAYSAPEQLMGEELDGRADQYALAATAYHLLTGTPPFSAPTNPIALISQHLNAAPPPVSKHRPELASMDHIFARGLDKEPARRYPTCAALAAAIATQAASLPAVSPHAATQAADITPPPATPAPPPRPPASQPPAPTPQKPISGGRPKPVAPKREPPAAAPSEPTRLAPPPTPRPKNKAQARPPRPARPGLVPEPDAPGVRRDGNGDIIRNPTPRPLAAAAPRRSMLEWIVDKPLRAVILAGIAGFGGMIAVGAVMGDKSNQPSNSQPSPAAGGRGPAASPRGGEGQLPAFSAPAGLGANCQYPAAGAKAREVTPPKTGTVPTDPATVSASMTTDQGNIGLILNNAEAPCTVNNFASLAQKGYFDDTVCHRLTTAPELGVLQCGDPTASGSGGPGYSFANEYPTNQYTPGDPALQKPVLYPRGTLAMANAGPDTNGSQFFLVYKDSQLPPNYTVFGTIDSPGLATLDKIAQQGVRGGGPDGSPATPVTIRSLALD